MQIKVSSSRRNCNRKKSSASSHLFVVTPIAITVAQLDSQLAVASSRPVPSPREVDLRLTSPTQDSDERRTPRFCFRLRQRRGRARERVVGRNRVDVVEREAAGIKVVRAPEGDASSLAGVRALQTIRS